MQVRSITVGLEVGPTVRAGQLAPVGRFLETARERLGSAGFAVQSTRLSTQPLNEILPPDRLGELPALGAALAEAAAAAGAGYVALGTVQPVPQLAAYARALPALVGATETVFCSLTIGSRAAGVDAAACALAAEVIVAVGRTTDRGFGNLRFAACANCPPNIPFFPAAYHAGGPPRFSFAVQAADLLVAALSEAGEVAELQARLVAALGREAGRIEAVARELEREFGWAYAGIDLSPAPFPTDEASVGGAVERLGVERFGGAGTLWATAFITAALRRVPVQRCGFSGLMLPVLEDSVLARRSSDGLVSLHELLLYSAVCGTGLDTVPLPGDATVDELAAVLLDVAALAVALDKPLTARLLPVPGAQPGDLTAFDFPFFVNSRVLPLKGYGAARLFERFGRAER